MRILVADNDFLSLKILQPLLSQFGETDIAVNGLEAIDFFVAALEKKKPYDLICLDIVSPEIDGDSILKKIRKIEEEKGILGLDGVKIIVTTIFLDPQNIKMAFSKRCEAYLPKPINAEYLTKLIERMNFTN